MGIECQPENHSPGVQKMSLSTEEIQKMAALAHIAIAPEEVAQFTEQLNHIVQFIDKINEC